MIDFKEQLLNVLDKIKGSGSFVSAGTMPFVFPEMKINGVEELGFPVNTTQINAMIKVARKAPFGKGSQTLIDTTVRSAWEIDASQITFNNNNWDLLLKRIIEQIKPDLGIEKHLISANLYKLLLYEEGDFFSVHKDSEKERGMFGTLIVGLPAKHTGGELLIKFEGREEVVDFSEPTNQYQIPFVGFYADCEHEIKPITSGHRLCLVYNLVQTKGKEKIQLNQLGRYVEDLAAILKTCEEDQDMPKIVLLGHQYTPSNFTMEALKLNDRPKAEVLLEAAHKAGFYAKIGLVTSYQMGELEMDYDSRSNYHRRNYYDDDSDEELAENGSMGEVYEEYVTVEHWMEGGMPPLRNIQFEEKDLISAILLNEDEPIERMAEGYTGNAGMELQYWYHYGAVFLWPQKYQYNLLLGQKPQNKLEWIDYYNKHWETLNSADVVMLKELIEGGLFQDDSRAKLDYDPLADLLINLNDEKYFLGKGSDYLISYFKFISIDCWVKLFEVYPISHFEKIIKSVAEWGKTSVTNHILAILHKLLVVNGPKYESFVMSQMEQMPAYLNALKLSSKNKETISKTILQNVLGLSHLKATDSEWLQKATDTFTTVLTRDYVNEVLVEEIVGKRDVYLKMPLAKRLLKVCKVDLTRRVNAQPQPPSDWSRPVPPEAGHYKKVWSILASFLQSPTEQAFDYQRLQALRSEMESAIRNVTIDLRTETIKKGSPHTLRLIKTQAAYEREWAKWQIDVGLLKKVEAW